MTMNEPIPVPPLHLKFCEMCDKDFEPLSDRERFCSGTCEGKWMTALRQQNQPTRRGFNRAGF